MNRYAAGFLVGWIGLSALSAAAPRPTPSSPLLSANKELALYFQAETTRLGERCLAEIKSLDDWKAHREIWRQQLREMLGLFPWPERTELKPEITGRVEQDGVTVEKLSFQSLPGLYVTANLYLPKGLTKPVPAVLYVCGHGPVISNGVSYGNKVSYQHHGAWFARHGYVCLVTDTVQYGEVLGLHHGTYREGMWWWNSRGYTPAGVEAWNNIRALDYLGTRPEVDANRIGLTGRSGGGAYSWTTAALDDRVKVIAPVAGITDLQNHVVDGVVEGHCDCMFFVNTYRWDYPLLAALCAPRPLLLVNTDSDTIFPLDGVMRTYAKVKHIYQLCRATNQLGLVIGPGPHKDTQNLQVPVFRWFNQHLKHEDPVIEAAATKLFSPPQLQVFARLPADAINTNIHDSFVPKAAVPTVPRSAEAWRKQSQEWLAALKEKCFAGWPEVAAPSEPVRVFSTQRHGLRLQAFDFASQPHVRLRLYTLQRATAGKPGRLELNLVGRANSLSRTTPPAASPGSFDESGAGVDFAGLIAALSPDFSAELKEELATVTVQPDQHGLGVLHQRLQTNNLVLAWLAPRGIGLTAWSGDQKKQDHLRRRFMLLGQTLDGMRVWDIRRAIQAVRSMKEWRTTPLWLRGEGYLACDALYAALFEPELAGLELWRLPPSHDRGPDFLNVLRILDVPQAAAVAAERCPVHLHQADAPAWAFPAAVASALGWNKTRFEVVAPVAR